MENILFVIRENWLPVSIAAIVLVGLLVATRRWISGPIQWTIELAIYAAMFHVVVHYVVRVARWFNLNSQMTWRDQDRVDSGWATPLVQFWDRTLYSPEWIVYVELGMVLLMVFMMYRIRPMKTQKAAPKRETP